MAQYSGYNPKSAGYTLTEIAISLGILAALVLMTIAGISRIGKARLAEEERMRFLAQVSEFREAIKQDVEAALLNNSYSAAFGLTYPAITEADQLFGLGTTAQTASQFSFQIFKPFHQSLSLPVTIIGKKAEVKRPTNGSPSDEEAFIQNALGSGLYFVVSNQLTQTIIKKFQSNMNSLSLQATPSFTEAMGAFTNQTNLIRSAEKITYRWNQSQGRIDRISQYQENNQRSQLMISNVRDFKVGYTFRRRNEATEDEELQLPDLPATPLTARNLPNSLQEAWDVSCLEGQPSVSPLQNGRIIPQCVKPKNINQIFVYLKLETKLSAKQAASIDPSYQGAQIRLEWDPSDSKTIAHIDFPLSARAFSDRLVASLATGEDISCQPTKSNHCKPQCSQIFTSLDRNSAYWVGYGRYKGHPHGSSDYCTCWTDHNSGQLETIGDFSVVPKWTANGDDLQNAQVNACGRHYRCEWAFTSYRDAAGEALHPGYNLACSCLQGPNVDHFIKMSAQHAPKFESITGPQVGGHSLTTNLTQYAGNSTSSNPFLDFRDRHLSCRYYGGCWQHMNQYFNTTTAQAVLQTRCGCLTNNIPYACDTRNIGPGTNTDACRNADGVAIDTRSLNFANLCNRDFRNDSGSLVCPNTWAPDDFSGSVSAPSFGVDIPVFQTNTTGGVDRYHSSDHTSTQANFYSRFAMNKTIIETCECLENQITGQFVSTSGNSFFQKNDGTIFTNYPATLSEGIEDLDFRTAIHPSTMPSIPGANPENPSYPLVINPGSSSSTNLSADAYPILASNKSAPVNGHAIVRTDTSGNVLLEQLNPTNSCSAVSCDIVGRGAGCCVSRQNPTGVEGVHPDLQAWNGFCDQKCTSFQWSEHIALRHEIPLIRLWITQTGGNETLPPTCGGNSSSGGSGAM